MICVLKELPGRFPFCKTPFGRKPKGIHGIANDRNVLTLKVRFHLRRNQRGNRHETHRRIFVDLLLEKPDEFVVELAVN